MQNDVCPQSNKSDDSSPLRVNFQLNYETFKASLNGKVIDYQKQSLIKNGLLIKNVQSIPGLPEELSNNLFISLSDQLKKFDRQYIMNKYCSQIASAIDRSTHTAYHIISKARSQSQGTNCKILVTFDNCLIFLHKIPKKIKYFVQVLKKIPFHKIQILMEDDRFFKQLFSILQQVYLRKGKRPNKNQSQLTISKSESKSMDEQQKKCQNNQVKKQVKNQQADQNEAQEKKTDQNAQIQMTIQKQSFFQKSRNQEEQNLSGQMKKLKKFYQRVNLLINFLAYDPNLTTFLYELNRRILINDLPVNMISLMEEQSICKQKKQFWKKKRQGQIVQRLQKVISSIQTTLRSLISSKISYPLIKQSILIDELKQWIEANLNSISGTIKMRETFLKFCAICCEMSPQFVNSLYLKDEITMSLIVEEEVARNFRTIKRQEQGKEAERWEAQQNLDQLMQIGLRVGTQYPNAKKTIGYKICESMLEYGGQFIRSSDIVILCSIIQVNVDIREFIMAQLLENFKKLLECGKNVKNRKIKLIQMGKCMEIVLKYPTQPKLYLTTLLITQLQSQSCNQKSDMIQARINQLIKTEKTAKDKLGLKDVHK